MKLISTIILFVLANIGTQAELYAQTIFIDSAGKSVDAFGSFNNAEVHLSAVKKQPQYPGGKKA